MGSLYTSHLIAGTNTLLKIKFLNVKQIKKHTWYYTDHFANRMKLI